MIYFFSGLLGELSFFKMSGEAHIEVSTTVANTL